MRATLRPAPGAGRTASIASSPGDPARFSSLSVGNGPRVLIPPFGEPVTLQRCIPPEGGNRLPQRPYRDRPTGRASEVHVGCRAARVGAVALMTMLVSVPSFGATRMTLGSSVGVEFFSYDRSRGMVNETVLGTSNSGSFMPGLSVGLMSSDTGLGAVLDFGYVGRTQSVDSRVGGGMISIQYDTAVHNSTGIFMNAGMGVYCQSSSTRPVLGGGFGVRHAVCDGHGRLRAEARFDRLFKDPQVYNDFLKARVVALRFGFDLVFGK
jgi:hypothetical protein